MNDSREIVRHFTYGELKCKCGNKLCEGLPPLRLHNIEFLKKLSVIRDIVGPLIVQSFYRCPLHDLYRKESGHSQCVAADLTPKYITPVELYIIASGHWGFTGIGLDEKRKMVHVDSKEGRVARWKYVNKKPEYLFVWRRK